MGNDDQKSVNSRVVFYWPNTRNTILYSNISTLTFKFFRTIVLYYVCYCITSDACEQGNTIGEVLSTSEKSDICFTDVLRALLRCILIQSGHNLLDHLVHDRGVVAPRYCCSLPSALTLTHGE